MAFRFALHCTILNISCPTFSSFTFARKRKKLYLCAEMKRSGSYIYKSPLLLHKALKALPLWCMVALLAACSATKFVPDESYLLEKVELKADTKKFNVASLEPYIRQKANSKWFSVFKIPLGTYAFRGATPPDGLTVRCVRLAKNLWCTTRCRPNCRATT